MKPNLLVLLVPRRFRRGLYSYLARSEVTNISTRRLHLCPFRFSSSHRIERAPWLPHPRPECQMKTLTSHRFLC